MCNPRSLVVRLTRAIAHVWEEEIQRTARLVARVGGEARATVPLMEAIGARTRNAFERQIAADTRWAYDSESFLLVVEAGYARYFPETGELEIVISMSDQVDVEVSQRERLLVEDHREIGTVQHERYYDDISGSEASAQRRADVAGVADLDRQEQAQRKHFESTVRNTAARESERIENEVQATAAERLGDERAAREAALAADTQRRLESVRDDTMADVHRLLGESLRVMVREYACSGEARNYVESVGEDGVITIQFEVVR